VFNHFKKQTGLTGFSRFFIDKDMKESQNHDLSDYGISLIYKQ